jgi:hypothetical protein
MINYCCHKKSQLNLNPPAPLRPKCSSTNPRVVMVVREGLTWSDDSVSIIVETRCHLGTCDDLASSCACLDARSQLAAKAHLKKMK